MRQLGTEKSGRRTSAALLALLSATLAVPAASITARAASSIFDDDWKPPAESVKPVKPVEAPPPPPPDAAPAAPRLTAKPETPTTPATPVAPTAPVTPATPATPATPTTPPKPATPAAPAVPAPLARLVRAAVPNATAVAAAEKMIREVFKAEYARKTAADQSAFARTLLTEAQQTRNDPASLYVLLRDARDLACASGDVEVAVEAARDTRDAFQIDALSALELEQSAYANAVKGMATAPPALLTYTATHRAADLGMQMAEYYLAKGNCAAAAAFATASEQAVARCKDWEYPARVRNRTATIQLINAEYEQDRASIVGVKSNPNDPAACQAAGRFHAFFLDQLDRGLPLLAKGTDPVLKSLAARDIAAGGLATASARTNVPAGVVLASVDTALPAAPATSATATPEQSSELADAWAEAAKGQVIPLLKDAMQRRALFWYDQAASRLEGLSKAAVEKRQTDLRLSRVHRGIAGHYFRGQDFGYEMFSRADSRIEFNWSGFAPENSMTAEYFSIRWEGWIKAPSPGLYKLIAVHDDCARVWLDGQLIIDKWTGGPSKESQEVQLTGGLQQIKIEYDQHTSGAYVGLGWLPPKASKAKAVPETALFHDPLPPQPVYTPLPRPDKTGQITLSAGQADIHGSAVYTHTGGFAEAVGMWNQLSTWLSWDFQAADGEYNVDITYSCDAASAGGQFVLSAGLNRLNGTVTSTGGWGADDARTEHLGPVRLGTGLQSLRINPTSKPGQSIMRLGQVVLTPVKK